MTPENMILHPDKAVLQMYSESNEFKILYKLVSHLISDEKFKGVLESQNLKGSLSQDTEQTLTQISLGETTLDKAGVIVTFDLFVCEDDGVCRMEKKTITQELKLKPPEDVLLTLDVE